MSQAVNAQVAGLVRFECVHVNNRSADVRAVTTSSVIFLRLV